MGLLKISSGVGFELFWDLAGSGLGVGLGVAKDLPLERWFREMRIRRIGEGPSEVQRHVIARELLGSSLR